MARVGSRAAGLRLRNWSASHAKRKNASPIAAMPAYRYEAVDARGKPRRGLIDAETPRQGRQELQEQGLFPTAIDAAAVGEGSAGERERLRLPPELVALSTRQ